MTRNKRSRFCLILLQLSFHSLNMAWWYMQHIKPMHCVCITYLQSNLFGVPFPTFCPIGHQARKLDKLPTWAWTKEGSINSKFVFQGLTHGLLASSNLVKGTTDPRVDCFIQINNSNIHTTSPQDMQPKFVLIGLVW